MPYSSQRLPELLPLAPKLSSSIGLLGFSSTIPDPLFLLPFGVQPLTAAINVADSTFTTLMVGTIYLFFFIIRYFSFQVLLLDKHFLVVDDIHTLWQAVCIIAVHTNTADAIDAHLIISVLFLHGLDAGSVIVTCRKCHLQSLF